MYQDNIHWIRAERAAWRDAQKLHVEVKRRADEIRMAEIEAEAEEIKGADEIKMQMAQLEADKEQAKIEADKELALIELELKAQQDQASARYATTPPPRNKGAKSPKLPFFIDVLNTTLKMQQVGRKTHGLLS